MVDPEAHHIIPYRDFPDMIEAQELRNLLEQAGISINDASNGVYLEKNFHRLTFGNKGKQYISAIYAQFSDDNLFILAETGKISVLRQKILANLKDIGLKLEKESAFWL